VLATQNPVDLDYKGLANTGTWFLGRLQTERDKVRVLDGLEGVAGGLDRAEVDRILSALKKRIFLMHNVHDSGPTTFETRWALSYLRGPLSRDQIRALRESRAMPPMETPSTGQRTSTPPITPPVVQRTSGPPPAASAAASTRPVVPPGIQEFFLPVETRQGGGPVTYTPGILGAARVTFSDRALGVDTSTDVVYLAPLNDGAVQLDWATAGKLPIAGSDLERAPEPDATFRPLPAAAVQPRKHAAWEKSFARWVAQNERIELFRQAALGVTSRVGESERDFRIRLNVETRAARDAAVDAVRTKYAAKQAALADRLKRAEAAVDREQQQASDSRLQTAVSFGATVLGALLGRKAVSTGTLGRATTAARGVGRSMKEASDVKRAVESVETVRQAIALLEEQIAADVAGVSERFDRDPQLDRVLVAPKRGQIEVQFVAIGWDPSGR
jgi:hypothetical protein